MMSTYYVEPPRELLDHEAHLPETVECSCGYVRPETS